MEASTTERRLRLVRQSLELDPENVDALLMLAQASEFDEASYIEVLQNIVAIGTKRLGKKAFKELVPHFWGFLETRPYMRARVALAIALREAGRLEEAAQEFIALLALNEDDNQGVRYELLPLLLSLSRLDEARALMKRYVDDCDWNVVFSWGRVLEFFLSGQEAAARDALTAAKKQNPHMESYLKKQSKLPKYLPGCYSPGSKEEAQTYAENLIAAWQAHSKAAEWLALEFKFYGNWSQK
jgi:tetratricopeptide (TPR) repeat protein